MPLDAAEFISELSIVDPPGTDPLNQGDNHIRVTKKAVQQSFPNVGSAVPQTGAQMAQMAIKNEVNTFTQRQLFAAGTAALPGISFPTEPTGLFLQASTLSFSVQGIGQMDLSAFGLDPKVVIRGVDGSAGAPAFSFIGQGNQGMYKVSAGELGLAAGGVQVARFGPTGAIVPAPMFAGDGSAPTPAYTFGAQTNIGMFRVAANQLGFATQGVNRMLIIGTQMAAIASGTATAPSWGFANEFNTGMFLGAANVLSFTVGGASRLDLANTQASFGVPIFAPSGSLAAPTYTFNASPGVGFFFSAGRMVFASASTQPFGLGTNSVFCFNLPQADPGVPGQLWRVATDLRVSI